MAVINMQIMRYINLLDRVSHVKTHNCFIYNNTIIFAVPRALIPRALGQNAENLRIIQENFGRRVRVVEEPRGILDAERFVSDIVSPVRFKSLEFRDGMLVLSAGSQSKASLIGRGKQRLEELNQIVKDNFGFELRIV